LRYLGWSVIRLWEHQIKRDPEACVARVLTALAARSMQKVIADNING
jgi:very-short-patch-repair endonuclease